MTEQAQSRLEQFLENESLIKFSNLSVSQPLSRTAEFQRFICSWYRQNRKSVEFLCSVVFIYGFTMEIGYETFGNIINRKVDLPQIQDYTIVAIYKTDISIEQAITLLEKQRTQKNKKYTAKLEKRGKSFNEFPPPFYSQPSQQTKSTIGHKTQKLEKSQPQVSINDKGTNTPKPLTMRRSNKQGQKEVQTNYQAARIDLEKKNDITKNVGKVKKIKIESDEEFDRKSIEKHKVIRSSKEQDQITQNKCNLARKHIRSEDETREEDQDESELFAKMTQDKKPNQPFLSHVNPASVINQLSVKKKQPMDSRGGLFGWLSTKSTQKC